jgi:hypothetical protein
METRRGFLRELTMAGVAVPAQALRPAPAGPAASGAPADDRAAWTGTLSRVVSPVLESLARNQLRARMPVECPTGKLEDRRKVTHLEAVGRTLAGLASWLELGEISREEATRRDRLADLARTGLGHAADPAAPDFLAFDAGNQCLVDAAFLAHAFVRAPHELWQKLDAKTQKQLVAQMTSTRSIKPGNSNWLLFSAMVETFLAAAGAEWIPAPVETALRSHTDWYKGDGAYGDGPDYHWDYYNSFVIQPFLIDVVEGIGRVSDRWSSLRQGVLDRARRYAEIQERLIAPDGSYPPIGRSIAYRCGAFQLLAQMALRHELPEGVSPPQVRSALSAVIGRTLGAPGTFDADGWLRIGLAGAQPHLAEVYISTGSLYLCTVGFLPLGLPASDRFWSDPPAEWTSRRAWSGQDLPADHALKG